MSIKKTNIIVYTALAITTLLAVFYLFKAKNLQQELAESENAKIELSARMADYQSLQHIDSMLVKGEYRGALNEYTKEIENKDITDIAGVKLRIKIAQRLLNLREGEILDHEIQARRDSLDSIQRTLRALPSEIKKSDSLGFALEKAKVQLNSMRQQLRKKSFGEYLTFNSDKGSQMHYVGQVKNNKANGLGVAILNTGSRYEGDWKANQRHGEGAFYWADGEYYKGSYVDDRRNGQGTYYWPNGEKYVGQWKDDKRNGKGIFYGPDGEIVTSGTWEDDKLVQEDGK